MRNLAGKNAILTGASQGIGPYIANALAAQGVNLLLIARSGEKLERVAAQIPAGNVTVRTAATDLTDPSARTNVAKRARSEFGQIDILVNNAGFEELRRFHRQEPEVIEKTIETNVLAPMLLTREVLTYMVQRGYGHIVNVSSLAGRLGMPYGATYAGSKGALAEWSLSLYEEMKKTGVGVSCVCPSFVTEAGMFARKKRKAPMALGDCRPEQVAAAVIKAIRDEKPEIIVSNRPARPFMVLRAISPRAAYWLGRKLGIVEFTESLASNVELEKSRES